MELRSLEREDDYRTAAAFKINSLVNFIIWG